MADRKILHTYEYQEFKSVLFEDQVIREYDKDTMSLWVTFNIPEKLNAGPLALWHWLSVFFPSVDRDDSIKTVVLRGAGDDFGTGGDATELGHYIGFDKGTDAKPRRPPQRRRVVPDREINFGHQGFEQALHRCSKVTIVEAKGYTYGAHLQLAMLADIVIASPEAVFTHPAFRYLGPFINVIPLVESMGLHKFKELVLTGRPFTADEMERAGLVNKIVPKKDLESTLRGYCKAVSLMPLDGLVMGKGLIEQALEGRGFTLGFVSSWTGHGWITNLRYEDDDFNFLKNRRDRGLTDAMEYRDGLAPEGFAISRKRRDKNGKSNGKAGAKKTASATGKGSK
jgi:enoyl-CoA hydratase